MPDVIGRDSELATARRLLERTEPALSCLLIRGEAGIGKTNLWTEVMRLAGSAGQRVLQCRLVEAESPLPFVALGDLMSSVEPERRVRLPPPQRKALEIALLEADAADPPLQSRAVGAGLASLLREASGEVPLVIGIDDIQWIDRSSESVLAFALRRLLDAPVTVVVSSREGVPPLVADLDGITTLDLEPLDVAGTFHLLRSQLGRVYARPTLVRLWEMSGGNPLYALEAARALEASPSQPAPGEPLPLPSHRSDIISERLEALSAGAKELLLAAALLSAPTIEHLLATLGGGARRALEEVVDGRIVTVDADVIRFGHPLYASVLMAAAGPAATREMHRKLAVTTDDPDARVRHLALGATEPDANLAVQLEAAASRAERRGAPENAADLYDLAHRLTPDEEVEAQAMRRIALAELTLRSGDTDRAWQEVERTLDSTSAPSVRGRALDLKARISFVAATPAEAVSACNEALADNDHPVVVRARLHAIRSIVGYDDWQRSHEDALTALALLGELRDPDPAVRCLAITAFAESELSRGRPLPMDLIDEGLELEARAPNPTVADRLSAALGAWLKYVGDFEGSRHWLELTHRAALEEGDEGSLPYAVSHLPQLELWSGNWEVAEKWAHEHLALAERTGQKNQRLDALFNLAQVWAHQGRVEEATRAANEGLVDSGRDGFSEMVFESVLGFIALSTQDIATANRHMTMSTRAQERIGALRPSWRMAYHVEALIASGDLGTAESAARVFEERAKAYGSPIHVANALRCRAVLEAAQQEADRARSTIEEAIQHHSTVTVPFDLALTLLAQGKILRRSGERRAAVDSLERAREIFAELGSPLWEAQASSEQKRVPIKRRSTSHALTEGEMRVARLAARGLSNREIAGELFISPKTVEANLSRVYTKLGLRSRAALATWMTAATAKKSEK